MKNAVRTQDIKITELKADPEAALRKVVLDKMALRITSHGKPKGYLVDVEYYDAFRERLAELERQLAATWE